MARVDYEAAWNALAELIATREGQGWGTDSLLAEMQKVAVKHQIPEDFIQKAARLYGVLPQPPHTHVPEATAHTSEAAVPLSGKPDPETSKARSRDERAEHRPHPPEARAGRDPVPTAC